MTLNTLKTGQKIDLVRYTDNCTIQATKVIEFVNHNTDTIRFKGINKTFTIHTLKNGNFQFHNHNTIYSTI